MRDLIYLLITLAFFATCVGLIKGCDLVIGPDELEDVDETPTSAEPRPEVIRQSEPAVTR